MQSDFLSADGLTENGILNGVYSIAAVSDSISDANDQISEAVSVTSGTYYSYQISESGDVDMFSITVSAGTTVTFATSQSVSAAIDTYIRLFKCSIYHYSRF